MVRLARKSDSLAFLQAVAGLALLFTIANPDAQAQTYSVDGGVWRYGDSGNSYTIPDDPPQKQDGDAQEKEGDAPGTDVTKLPLNMPDRQRGSGTVPRRASVQTSKSGAQLLRDDAGNYFLWVRKAGSTEDLPDGLVPVTNVRFVGMRSRAAPVRSRGSPQRHHAAAHRSRPVS
jgi:hypothetical protein